ncbi:MAG: GTPase-activating protein, partial [Pseudonocardia sp.]|nr:GTPase-activating protein [Pseudonocardia sp.]
ADVSAVQVIGTAGGTPARRVADGVFDLGVVPNRGLAPADQAPDTPATLELDRSDPSESDLVVLPVAKRLGSRPVRTPLALIVDGKRRADPAVRPAVLAVLPSFLNDPRVPALLDQAPGYPSLTVRTAVLPGGHGVTVAAGGPEPAPGLPVFRYFVPDSGPVVAATD